MTKVKIEFDPAFPKKSIKKGYSMAYDYGEKRLHICDPDGKHVCHGATEPNELGRCPGFPFPAK